MVIKQKEELALFLLRISVFLVMLMWTLDKWINPQHTAKVFEKFYMIPDLSTNASYLIGVVQMLLILAFVLGLKKSITYGGVLILHSISTVSSYGRYLDPWTGPNLLFFAAFPMLAATITLFLLRDRDRLLTL